MSYYPTGFSYTKGVTTAQPQKKASPAQYVYNRNNPTAPDPRFAGAGTSGRSYTTPQGTTGGGGEPGTYNIDGAGIPWTGSGGDIQDALVARGVRGDLATHYGALVRQGQMSPDQVLKELNGGGGGGGYEGGHGKSFATSAKEYMDMQLKYLPKIKELEAELYQKYAPVYAQTMKDTLDKMYPEQSGLGEYLAEDTRKTLELDNYDVPDSLKAQYLENLRGGQSDRGLFRSGMASTQEARDLSNMGIQMRENSLNRGERLSAGVPKATIPGAIPGDTSGINNYYQAANNVGQGWAGVAQGWAGLDLQRQGLEQSSLNAWRNYQLQANAMENSGGFDWGGLLGTGLGIGASFLLPGIGSALGFGAGAGGATTSYGIKLGANALSDVRLKKDLTLVGTINGINFYSWEWNDKANELGQSGRGYGVVAQDIEGIIPDAVGEQEGYKTVNYEKIMDHIVASV